MEYRKLGKSGLKVSALSLGSWVTFGKQVDISAAKKLLQSAYDNGVNFFDNAEGYEAGESEKIMGAAILSLGLPRDTYAVSSKVYWGGGKPTQIGLSAKHVRDACDAALIRLNVDYLDLFYCSFRVNQQKKPLEPCTIWCNRAKWYIGARQSGRLNRSPKPMRFAEKNI